MSSEAFLSLYLKEIGVEAPISSFVTANNIESAQDQPIQNEPRKTTDPQSNVVMQPSMVEAIAADLDTPSVILEAAEPSSPFQSVPIKPVQGLQALQQQAELCTSCDLVNSRNKLVFGSGSVTADLVFIGDAPGREEDIAGLPYVGSSGDLLDRMLLSIGLSRDGVYLMNGVKCRPLHSRDPKPLEFSTCDRWLIA